MRIGSLPAWPFKSQILLAHMKQGLLLALGDGGITAKHSGKSKPFLATTLPFMEALLGLHPLNHDSWASYTLSPLDSVSPPPHMAPLCTAVEYK